MKSHFKGNHLFLLKYVLLFQSRNMLIWYGNFNFFLTEYNDSLNDTEHETLCSQPVKFKICSQIKSLRMIFIIIMICI